MEKCIKCQKEKIDVKNRLIGGTHFMICEFCYNLRIREMNELHDLVFKRTMHL